MGWMAAIGPALTTAAPYVAAGTSLIAGRQASAAGKYNQAVYNRNALVAEQEAAQIEKQTEFDLARFDKQFAQLQGQTKTNILFSGAELSGSGLRILRQNAEEAELENGDKVFAFDIVTEQMLDADLLKKESQSMFELAKKCGVDYDGWGTYFEE